MDYQTLRYEQQDKVVTVTLNDPDTRNAITNPVLLEEVISALIRIQQDDGVSVCILTGAGKGFSSGGNIWDMLDEQKMFQGEPLQLQENYRKGIHRLTQLLYTFDKPTIAAVNGAAVGAGLDLALLCDLRIGSGKARFGSTFINLALIPGDGGAWLLRKAVGPQRAAELVLSGRIIDADEALEIGLILKKVRHEELLEHTMGLAQTLAEKSPDTLRIAKRLLRSADSLGYSEHLELCSANQAMLHRTEHHKAALQAFIKTKN